MSNLLIIGVVLAIGLLGFILGMMRSRSLRSGGAKLHSLPFYHGSFVFLAGVPIALILLAAWTIGQPLYIQSVVENRFPAEVLEQDSRLSLAHTEVDQIVLGLKQLDEQTKQQVVFGLKDPRAAMQEAGVPLAGDPELYMLQGASDAIRVSSSLEPFKIWSVISLAALGVLIGLLLLGPKLKARNQVEQFIKVVLMSGALIAIMTTFGIVMSMVFEAINFFNIIPPQDFFFSTVWDPGFEDAGEEGEGGGGSGFGLLPLLWGTMYISFIALLIAVPIGLYAAVYMSEFASPMVRSIGKPLLEILAGVPTIVYGFFALVTVGPFIRDTVNMIPGMDASASSVATAGVVMGIMIIPFISSLSDDIINSVPQSLRDGSLGLGATKAETVRLVVLPAALPGIVGAIILAASRAIGETMIVVLAAGATATISGNPFEAMTTVTVMIVKQLTGDVVFTSPQALVAFALGITLFVVTLTLNIIALRIVRKYREQYE